MKIIIPISPSNENSKRQGAKQNIYAQLYWTQNVTPPVLWLRVWAGKKPEGYSTIPLCKYSISLILHLPPRWNISNSLFFVSLQIKTYSKPKNLETKLLSQKHLSTMISRKFTCVRIGNEIWRGWCDYGNHGGLWSISDVYTIGVGLYLKVGHIRSTFYGIYGHRCTTLHCRLFLRRWHIAVYTKVKIYTGYLPSIGGVAFLLSFQSTTTITRVGFRLSDGLITWVGSGWQ